MSNLARFSAALESDPALQAKVQAIQGATPQDSAEKLAALSREVGHPVTAEEFLAAASEELSCADLESVAGGFFDRNVIQMRTVKNGPPPPRIIHTID